MVNTITDTYDGGMYKRCEACNQWSRHSEVYFECSTGCEVCCALCGEYVEWVFVPQWGRTSGTWQIAKSSKLNHAEVDLLWLMETHSD